MESQLEGRKTMVERAIAAAILYGEICNTLALILAFLVFALLAWPFTRD